MTEGISERDLLLLREKFKDEPSLEEAKRRLLAHEPLAYILGEWYFYNEVYTVSPACLVPRPETEHLVDELIRRLPQGARFADLCTGSGCIAISTLAARPDLTAVAIDISPDALTLAEENARRNSVAERISFRCGNILTEDPLGEECFDAIVSNPPYIASDIISTLSPEVQCEPRLALDGGKDGLLFYRRFLSSFRHHLTANGLMLFEIGYDQGDALRALASCQILKDYSGNDRVAILTNATYPSQP